MAPRIDARTRDREPTASTLLAEACADFDASRALVVDDHAGEAEASLGGEAWRRWALRLAPRETRARVHAPSPPPGPFDLVALRLPRDWGSFDMQLHLVAARLAAGGRLLVVGANDEGIKSAPRRIESLFERVDVVLNKRRMRVLHATGLRASEQPRGSLEDWRQEVEAAGLSLLTYPGVFAEGRLDDASALLLEALGEDEIPPRVLDFGCGHGMLACVLAGRARESAFTLLDVDALALDAAAHNLPGARRVISDGWSGLGDDERFDLIVSNPPIHRGRDEDFSVLESLVREAPSRLATRGRLVLVAQRTVGAGTLLRKHLSAVKKVRETPRFQVWSGRT